MVRATRGKGRGKNEHVGTFITQFTRLFAPVYDMKMGIDIYPEADLEILKESGVEVFVRIVAPRGKSLRLNLTRLTRPELEMFAEMINVAIDVARPVTTARDEEAQEVEHGREDEHALRRLYARIPVLLVKEGPVSGDMPELPIRPEGDEEMVGFKFRRVPYTPPAGRGAGGDGADLDGGIED